MPDNPVAPVVENPVDPANPAPPDPTQAFQQPPPTPAPVFSWKAALNPDFANSPTLLKFPDTREGFNDAVKSHLSLERMLGNEKIPVPKGKDDVEAWSRFSKAFGIPDKPDGYALPEIEVPESMKGLSFDKKAFAEIVHQHRLTPEAAKGLWEAYTEKSVQAYAKALKTQEEKMQGVINQLRTEWGDAYPSKVQLGQMVINRFSEDKETNDFITSYFAQDPRGIKFLAKIGEQFSENKIGDFGQQRFSLTPQQAREEHLKIISDPKDPYNNEKLPEAIRQKRFEYVHDLIRQYVGKI